MTKLLPAFETGRLLLRQRTMADLEDCIGMDRDPEVTRFVPGPWNDPDAHRRFVRSRIETDFGPGLGYWSIFAKEKPAGFLGWILLIPADGAGPEIEIGWRLNRISWGKGYATEAARPVLVHAFTTVGLDKVIADIASGNASSIRVAQKLGLTVRPDGEASDKVFVRHAITRDAFEAARSCEDNPDAE
jgi:RimJ/RimL family protein N-acetyltransferase